MYPLGFIENKKRILTISVLSVTWMVSMTVMFVAFSVFWICQYVTRQLGIGLYTMILSIIAFSVMILSGRMLDNKFRKEVSSVQQENQPGKAELGI
jgi:hypothetical protein